MVEKVAWSFNVDIENGPSMNFADSFETEAYDKISIKIDSGETDKSAAIQPSDLENVDFLCIESDNYGPDIPDENKTVTYKCDGGDPITLDQAHALIGNSLVKLLKGLKTLSFTNTTDKPANIDILLGRRVV